MVLPLKQSIQIFQDLAGNNTPSEQEDYNAQPSKKVDPPKPKPKPSAGAVVSAGGGIVYFLIYICILIYSLFLIAKMWKKLEKKMKFLVVVVLLLSFGSQAGIALLFLAVLMCVFSEQIMSALRENKLIA